MGRYYNGDIEGKFWFGVQDSTDASFFGADYTEPNYVEYYFEKEEHMDSVNEGIATCITELGEYKDKMDNFFNTHDSYNDEQLAHFLGFITKEESEEAYSDRSENTLQGVEKVKRLLEWYARLKLGQKIQKCLEETGECTFQAEL